MLDAYVTAFAFGFWLATGLVAILLGAAVLAATSGIVVGFVIGISEV